MQNEATTAHKIPGDGGNTELQESDVSKLKGQVNEIWTDASKGVFSRRRYSEDTRLCIWAGQSPDGRKWQENLETNETVFPFDGAHDSRVRLADEIINERVALLVMAATRTTPQAAPVEVDDYAKVASVNTFIKWLLNSQIGKKAWRREIKKLAQYQEGDAPGLGIMGVFWDKQFALKNETMEIGQLGSILVELSGGVKTKDDLEDILDLIKNEEREDEAVTILFPWVEDRLSESALRDVLKQIRENGKAVFPVKYVKSQRPMPIAYRYLDDIFFPSNTPDDLQQATEIFVRQWLSATQLEEKQVSEGWSKDFVEEVLKNTGQSIFPAGWNYRRISGDYSLDNVNREEQIARRGQFEIITVYRKRTNSDGVPGVYFVPFSGSSKVAAKEEELLSSGSGLYPFTEFPREIISNKLEDTRGVGELVMTQQRSKKVHEDLQDDSATITTLPPYFVPQNRPKTPLVIRPLSQITRRRQGDYEWFPPLPQPTSSENRIKQIDRAIDRYWGRANPENSNDMVATLRQDMVDSFQTNLTAVIQMIYDSALENYEDDDVQRVIGRRGVPLAQTVDEVRGRFDFTFTYFDVRTLDIEFLKVEGEIINNLIVPLDRESTIQYDRIVQSFMMKLDPDLAADVLQPVEDANQRERDDEMRNFTLIASGIMPQMVDGGQNFQLRLKTMQELLQDNPQAIEDLTPAKRQLLEKWMEYRSFMVQQMKNAQTGRVGVEQE